MFFSFYTGAQPRGQKPTICTREEQYEGRRGQNSRICTRGLKLEGITGLRRVTHDTIACSMRHTCLVSRRQAGSGGGTHSASLRSALLPSPASSLSRELVSGRHLPLPEAVGWPRPPRHAACLASHRHCPIFPLKSLVSVTE